VVAISWPHYAALIETAVSRMSHWTFSSGAKGLINWLVFLMIYVVCPKSKCTDFPMDELVM
jgi:hypothetical protein